MDCYRPVDITEHVKALCREHKEPRTKAPGFVVPSYGRAFVVQGAVSGYGGHGGHGDRDRHEHKKVKTFGKDSFSLDKETVDLRYVEQLADSEQTCGLAHLLRYAVENVIDGRRSVSQVVQILSDTLDKKGWEPFSSAFVPCGLAKPRRQEIFACLNRYRG